MRQTLAVLLVVICTLCAGLAHAQSPSNPYSYSRGSAFTYDATTGLLKTETVEPNNVALCVTTTYSYDSYGNKAGASTANCAGASGAALFTTRSSGSLYAQQTVTVDGASVTVPPGSFPSQSTNALSQSENKTFDPRFGAALSLTGPNLLTTSWQVDDFGRTVLELRADGTRTASAYCFIASKVSDTSSNSATCPTPSSSEVPALAVSFVHSEPHNTSDVKNGPFTRVYMDAAGRKIRTVTEAFDGSSQTGGASRLIVQDTDYNAQGAPLVSTQPYFLDSQSSTGSGSGDYGMSMTIYDMLGRPLKVYVSDPKGNQGSWTFGSRGSRVAALTSMTYSGLVTVSTNDQNQTRQEEKNVDSKVVRVTDALGAQVAYQFDAFGNLLQTKDALQNSVTMSYDIRGHKVSMNDPDSGASTYGYDALGQLLSQQNATQTTPTTMSYDVLGRMTQRLDPGEYTSNWYYDSYSGGGACTKGIGKLCESTTTTGLDRKMVYDQYGRLINTSMAETGGPSMGMAVGYDSANGRIASRTWPTGLTVNYAYTAKGFMSQMTLATAATVNPLPATVGGAAGASQALPAGSVLWQALSYSAWGKAEKQQYGNGVVATDGFEGPTGRALTSTAGTGGASNVMSYAYTWDSLGHLSTRADALGDGTTGTVQDTLHYDQIGRLQNYSVSASAIPGLARSVELEYNALGSTLYKSDVGVYSYPAQGGAHPHAVQTVVGAFNAGYGYDAKGNVTSATNGSYRSVSYTSFNLPDSSTGLTGPSGSPKYTWVYDENHQRIKEVRVNASGTRTTYMMHPDNAGGLFFETEQTGSAVSNRHYLTAGGGAIGVLIQAGALPAQTTPPAVASITLDKVEYWHKDMLGSLVATSDHTGAVTARYSYDPFGKRRTASGNYDASGALVYDWNNTNSGTDRGYTGHEHLDDVGVIHMNGRIYDPLLGRFMQADPFVQDPGNLQNFNRYGYCYNNPMTCSDPTGQFFGIDDWIVYSIIAIWGAEKAGIIDARTARTFTSIVVAAALPIPTNIGQAAETGFVSGAISTGNLKGGLQGAFTAGMFYGAGSVINGGNFFSGVPQNVNASDVWSREGAVALHGVVGCVTSVIGGGKCGPGALSAAFSETMSSTTQRLTNENRFEGAFASAVVGGTGSVLGGGKFSNGAETGAFSYLFNDTSDHKSIQLAGGLGFQLIYPGIGISGNLVGGVNLDGFDTSFFLQGQGNVGAGVGVFAGAGGSVGPSWGDRPVTGVDSAKYLELDAGYGGAASLSATLEKNGSLAGGSAGGPLKLGYGIGLGMILGTQYTLTAATPTIGEMAKNLNGQIHNFLYGLESFVNKNVLLGH